MTLPPYYTSLKPFAAWFSTGIPILTYHKVGPRPWGARLKGLYASPGLFDRQMRELHAAGFRPASLDALPHQAQPGTGTLVISFDDGFEKVFRHALAPMASTGFTAIQFLVSGRLGGRNDWEMAAGENAESLMDAAQVRDWLAAGHQIGSHTQTHPYLTRIPPRQAKEEISTSKRQLEDLFGCPIRHFCYPYGDYSPAVRDLVQEAGYATACTVRGGMNTPATPPFELVRMTVRYRSRSLKSWWRGWRR